MNLSLLHALLILASPTAAHASDAPVDAAVTDAKLTDLAALSIQDQSITKLKKLLHQYKGSPQEADLLSRLADLTLQRSGITFRISEGTSVKSKSPLYMNSLLEGIRVYSELLKKFPNYSGAAAAIFKRGKAYKELGKIKEATLDFQELDQRFHDFESLDSALLDLADFAQDANHHAEALIYLAKIEKIAGSEYYPVALHRTAWSHYNLKQYPSAIDYLQKEINFYFDRLTANSHAETAFLEGAFNDLALFEFETFNQKTTSGSMAPVLDLIQKLDRNQHYFGTTVAKFSKLLKAYALHQDLQNLGHELMKRNIQSPQASEVALLLFQFHFERREFNHLGSILTDLNQMRKAAPNAELDRKIEVALSNSLTELHRLVIKNKAATELGTLLRPLTSLTESVSDLLGKENATALLAKYSLAETNFELGNFKQATLDYLELLNPAYAAVLSSKKLTTSSLTLRLLASRFQEIKNEHLIASPMIIRKASDPVSATSKVQLALIQEWTDWVHTSMRDLKPKAPVEEQQSWISFTLEAYKLGYEYLNRDTSMTGLEKFAFDFSQEKESETAISIVLDTLSLSQNWEGLYALAERINATHPWKAPAFAKKVQEMRADTFLKITLKTEDPALLLARSTSCLNEFEHSSISQECHILKAKSELKLNHLKEANDEITHLLSEVKDIKKRESLLLLRADARTQLGQMSLALADLTEYQKLTHFEDSKITQNLLQYYWFKRDQKHLSEIISNSEACKSKSEDFCDSYRVVQLLESGSQKHPAYTAEFKNTIKAPKGQIAIWALLALEQPKKLPFQDRLILLQRLAGSWENLDPFFQIHLFPVLQDRVKDALESIRLSSPGIAPLTSTPESIERRMKLTQDIDATFAKIMRLNWIELKIKGASELSEIYQRLLDDLRGIHTPENLLTPFVQKLAETKKAVQDLKNMSMTFPARSIASMQSPQDLLLSAEIKKEIPVHLWDEWKTGVMNNQRDYLFYLLSLMETSAPVLKANSSAIKGLALLTGNAPTEAYELIRAAPESAWKTSLLAMFQTGRGNE